MARQGHARASIDASLLLYIYLYRRLSGTTSYLAAQTKNVLSHRAVEERSITRRADEERRFYGQYLASIRRDTTFFVRGARWVVLQPPGDGRLSSSACRDTTLFR